MTNEWKGNTKRLSCAVGFAIVVLPVQANTLAQTTRSPICFSEHVVADKYDYGYVFKRPNVTATST